MKFKPCCIIAAALVAFLATATANAQSMDLEIKTVTTKLAKDIVAKGRKKVAALDFTDIQGRPTELGRFLAEQVSVEMVGASEVSVVDRANIKSILAEHKLSEEGLVNPENAKKIGQFAGVDAILVGTVTSLDDGVVLTIKAVATDTAEIVAAGKTKFSKTSEIQTLLNRAVSGSATATGAMTEGSGSSTSYQNANAIATKDIGSLRVVLKSVMPVGPNDSSGRSTKGIHVSLELTSRETRRPLVVAMNGESHNRGSSSVTLLRSGVVDDRGGVWKLSSQDLGGLGFVHAGVHGRNGQHAYSASEIVRLLRLRDELGRDVDDPSDGTSDLAAAGFGGFIESPGAPKRFFAFKGNTFISGSTTTIEPGRSVAVTMIFHQKGYGRTSASSPTFFQLNSEIVVGIVEEDTKKSYSLHNLTFDRVSLPADGVR